MVLWRCANGDPILAAVSGAGTARAMSPFSSAGKVFAPLLRSIVDVAVRVIHNEMGAGRVDPMNLWLLAPRRKSDCSQLAARKAGGVNSNSEMSLNGGG